MQDSGLDRIIVMFVMDKYIWFWFNGKISLMFMI